MHRRTSEKNQRVGGKAMTRQEKYKADMLVESGVA